MPASDSFAVPSPFESADQIVALRFSFMAGTLAISEWTHTAQLAVALGLVCAHGAPRALAVLTDRLGRWRGRMAAERAARLPTARVHQTLAAFLIHGAALHVVEHPRAANPLADLDALVARWGDPELPLTYYSLALLFSDEARDRVTPPDLRPLPTPWD